MVLYVGTVVTGTGPHAGDVDAPRNGLDPLELSQLHADLVFLLVGLTVAAVLVAPLDRRPRRRTRAAVMLLAVEVAQGLIGFVQYFTDLPVAAGRRRTCSAPPCCRPPSPGCWSASASGRERSGSVLAPP